MAGVVTGLKLHPGKRNRVDVYLDGRKAFDLPKQLAVGLKVGQRLSEEQIGGLRVKEAEETAYQRGLRLVGVRPRSEEEIRRAYERRSVPLEIQEAAIARLRQSGLLDDHAFAQAWVENRQTFRPRSRRALKSELRGKGVPPEAVEAAVQSVDDEALAYQAARRIARRLAGMPEKDFRRRLGAALARRGFDYEVIKPVVTRVWRESAGLGDESEGVKWNSSGSSS